MLDTEPIKPTTEEQAAPDFIQPSDLTQLSDEEYDKILVGIRERRLVAVALHTQAVRIRNLAKGEKLQAKADRYIKKIDASLKKIDAEIEKFQQYTADMRALRIQAIELEELEV